MTARRESAVRARKWVAAAASGLILGLQLLVMAPRSPFAGTWYWPFTNYTMYAYASREGDTVTVRRLLGVPCDTDQASSELIPHDLRSWPAWFQFQLEQVAAGGGPDAARRRGRAIDNLEDRLALYSEGEFCTGELWTKTLRLSPDLSLARSVPWTLAHRWTIAEDGARPAIGTGPHGEAP